MMLLVSGLLKGLKGVRGFLVVKKMFFEISIGSFTKFGSPWVKACVIQCGRCCVEVGGLKGFSRICLDVGVDPE